MTEEQPPAPACRHLLTVRGGTLACTLKRWHGHHLHQDDDVTNQEGNPARWTCSCPPSPGVSVCITFRGYVDETA